MNKNDNIGYVCIGVLIALFIYAVWGVIEIVNRKPVTYEYALDGKIYTSDKCQVVNDTPYCYDETGLRKVVDNYYEK